MCERAEKASAKPVAKIFFKCKNMTLFHLCTADISGEKGDSYFPVFSKDVTS